MKSPCINVCDIDKKTGTCKGCGRTIEEITNWSSLTEKERERVMERLKEGPD
jgi:hypothetical protein